MNTPFRALSRQHGLSLVWVGIVSALLALAAMAALFSMRYERNLFAEAISLVSAQAKAGPVAKAADSARNAVKGDAKASAPPSGELRRCVIDGVTVISNVDCTDKNPTSKKIIIRDNKGFDSGKKAEAAGSGPAGSAPPASAPTSNPAIDKIIEKQLN